MEGLDGQTFTDPAVVKRLARKAQLGEAFKFDRETYKSDGVFRSSPEHGLHMHIYVSIAILVWPLVACFKNSLQKFLCWY